MAAVDSFHLLYRQVSRSCGGYVEGLALLGALYAASKAALAARGAYRLLRLHFLPRLVKNRDLVRCYGRWALVSGASGTVVKAYAEELARHGVSIIILSPDIGSLSGTATAISESHGVDAVLVEVDFSHGPSVCRSVQDAIRDRDVGFVVNGLDAGLDVPHDFAELSEGWLWDVVTRATAAATLVTRLALPGMVARRRGAVVNISSGASCRPGLKRATLSASTAFLEHFSRALHHEYGGRGIFVQSVTPLHVAARAGTGSWLAPDGRVYARHAVSTLGICHRTTGYWPHALQAGLARWMPEWMWVTGSRLLA
ncbi:inactive hydroxysteroid dehydrogenase-like protein 1 [Denticeps clupeoides]|uniref:Inactive hydroxysteroid dehydrogenase-like protein 1 n=1 Tax=Denticeps clupeoides TaxID=299321 RepID=A0AAY4CSR9_9TELE|nr:inactive hydroxysteroid dehydrogenase-like protein 1 [Denticeps clupeoides]